MELISGITTLQMFEIFGKSSYRSFLKMCCPIFLKNSFISALAKCLSELVVQLLSLLTQNVKL